MEVPVQTPKLNVLTTLQELCLRSNLYKRAFRIPIIAELLSWGEDIAQEMSLEPTFQLMQRWAEQLEKDMMESPKNMKQRNSSGYFTIQIM